MYAEPYPDRYTFSARTIERLVFRTRETGSFHRKLQWQNRQISDKNEIQQALVQQ